MPAYFVHNGYCGWSYGTPSDPQLVSVEDAAEIMRLGRLSSEQVELSCPPAQYAQTGDALFGLTGGNRFLVLAEVSECADVKAEKTNVPLRISWPAT